MWHLPHRFRLRCHLPHHHHRLPGLLCNVVAVLEVQPDVRGESQGPHLKCDTFHTPVADNAQNSLARLSILNKHFHSCNVLVSVLPLPCYWLKLQPTASPAVCMPPACPAAPQTTHNAKASNSAPATPVPHNAPPPQSPLPQYIRKYESGGLFWPFLFDRLCEMLIVMSIFTACVFIVKAAYVQACLLIVLSPIWVLRFKWFATVGVGCGDGGELSAGVGGLRAGLSADCAITHLGAAFQMVCHGEVKGGVGAGAMGRRGAAGVTCSLLGRSRVACLGR